MEARKSKAISQRALAQMTGISYSALSKIENSTRQINVIEFLAITEAIGVDALEILQQVANVSFRALKDKSLRNS